MGFGNRDLQSAALEAMLILFMNLQILAMQKMTVSPESFEIQSSIRLAFLEIIFISIMKIWGQSSIVC